MKKILVIEDEPQTLYLLLECLKNKYFYTIGAEDGVKGVRLVKEYLPDLIICDILMPKLDGYGVLKALRQDPAIAIIPFIFLTAKGSKADIRKGMELGADDYLIKPCTFKEILKAISIQLEKQAFRQNRQVVQQPQTSLLLSAKTSKPITSESIFPSSGKLSEVFQFIESNYHRQITLHDVAELMGYSPTYLTNLMGQYTGHTVYSWVVKRRMAEACSLLLKNELTVNQIAEAVGYQDASYFSRQFRQFYGMTPKAWQKKAGVAGVEIDSSEREIVKC